MNTELIDLAERIHKYAHLLSPRMLEVLGEVLFTGIINNELAMRDNYKGSRTEETGMLAAAFNSMKWAAYPQSSYGAAHHLAAGKRYMDDFEILQHEH